MEVKNMKGKLNKFMAVALAVMIGTGGSFQWAAASEVTSQTEADLLTGESVQAGDEGAAADTKTDADDGAGTAGTEKNSENETKTSETEDENSESAIENVSESETPSEETETVSESESENESDSSEESEALESSEETEALESSVNTLSSSIEYDKISVVPDGTQGKFTVHIQNLSDSSFQSLTVPVWSKTNGQDDILWYTATKVSASEWKCTVDLHNHKGDAGEYEVHVYGQKADGTLTLINGSSFEVEGIAAAAVNYKAVNSAQGLYRIEVSGLASAAGISKVQIPVWSENGGQDDIVWYDAKQSGSIWYADVDIRNHGYDSGLYNAHVYATDNRGIQSLVGYTKFNVTQMPKNQVQVDLSSDQTKATITLKNASIAAGADYVSFPVWGEASGQNDIVWYRANKLDDHTYQVTIPISNHKESGSYQVHAYAMKGSEAQFLGNNSFKIDGISGKITVTQKDDVNGYFTLSVSNVSSPAAITEIQIPVWSENGGQDDIQWYTAQKSGNQWIVKVDVANHKLDTGTYQAHVYATDSRGIYGLITNTTINVKKPTVSAKISAQVLEDQAMVNLTATNVLGASKVQVPVWGESGGQNDICWYDMHQVDSRTWQVTVPLGNHMETGTYQAHVYATINNVQQLVTNTFFQINQLIVNAISVSNSDDETGNFTVNIQNISGISNVNSVLVAVWSADNGQDDIIWYPATFSNGKWTVNINTKDHNFDRGTYYAHVYAYNAAGQSLCVGGITQNVVINGKLGFIREGSSIYYYPTLGNKAYGFERLNGSLYFFDRTTGAMAVGWNYVDGYKYYFDDYGRMVQDVDAILGLQSSYILMINKQSNCVTMYAYDPVTASYCIPVKSMLCSTGDATPLGTYPLGTTYRWLLMYNGTYCQYLSLITGDYLIHSITYERYGDIYSLQTIGYNMLGVNKSAGCVRLRCGDAYWVYNLVNSGRLRQVTIYNSATPGPFDKPYVAPIPSNQTWDPTDPALQ